MCDIYHDFIGIFQVIDLLNSNQRRALPVRWSKNKGFYVENLFIVECETIDDLFAVLEEGRPRTVKLKLKLDRYWSNNKYTVKMTHIGV